MRFHDADGLPDAPACRNDHSWQYLIPQDARNRARLRKSFLDSYSDSLTNNNDSSTQYPDDASPWSLVLCLSIGWFLTYIYVLLACTIAYKRLQTTRFRYFFSIFTHMSRNDPIMLRLRQLDEEDPENEADALFEPLN